MKIVVFSDLHLHPWPEFAQIDTLGRNTRLMDCVSIFDQVADVAHKVKPDLIVFCGDLFHKRATLNTQVFNLGVQGVAKLASVADVVLIPGNHDQADRTGSIHALESMEHIDNVRVYHRPELMQSGRHKFLMVPYQPDADGLRSAFKMFPSADVAFIHAGVEGATVGSFEARPPEEFKAADFGKLEPKQRIFSGHYHKPQSLPNARVTYIGAPLQHTRADAGEERGCVVLDSDKHFGVTRVAFNYPRFVKLNSDMIAETPLAEWDVKGNFVDIVLDQEPSGGIARFRSVAERMGARGISIQYTPPPAKSEKRLNVDPSMSLPVMLERYVEEFGGALDKKLLLKLGRGAL